jgi:hypothetical protein
MKSYATTNKLSRYYILSLLFTSAACVSVAQLPSEKLPATPIKPHELECCQPFLEASKGLLDCEVSLDHGDITIKVTSKAVLMTPRSDSSAEPGEFVRDWTVQFVMCPTVSPNDLKRIRNYQAQQAKSVSTKKELRQIYGADVKTKANWYRIVPNQHHPVLAIDKVPMEKFVERLSKQCTTIEGGNSLDLLTKVILKDPLLDQ